MMKNFLGFLILGGLSGSSLAAISATQSQPALDVFPQIPPSTDLEWYPCQENFSCAVFSVPLDYSDGNGTLENLALIKRSADLTASSGTYDGMILFNPGGPGDSGVDLLLTDGEYFASILGPSFDLVSWDPRGIGASTPSVNCSYAVASTTSSTSLRRRLFKIEGPVLADSIFEDYYAEYQEIGKVCESLVGGPGAIGRHMTTADTARDIIQVVDAFERSTDGQSVTDSHLVNYWGFSYGTFLGQTLASMFPGRIGRVVVDGVVAPDGYLTTFGDDDIFFSDQVFATYFVYCSLAGSEECPYGAGSTPSELYDRFEKSFLQLDASRAAAEDWGNTTIIQDVLASIKTYVAGAVYAPISSFPQLSDAFLGLEAALQNGTLEAYFEELNSTVAAASGVNIPEWLSGVVCSDDNNKYFNKTLDEVRSDILTLEAESVIQGERWASLFLGCTGWGIKGDPFTGPFGANTSNPILFVSNTLDPVTPIYSSQRNYPKYKDAQLLTIEGTGHSTLGSLNLCANIKIAKYFQTGELPGDDNFCPLEAGPFNITLTGGLTKRSDFQEVRAKLGAFVNTKF